ncbi:MAG: MOSC domain-containing protein [Candidatus Delongbacteria bacterium]|jgi:MOSC domain-containing protein YiiM|nr:MOSC domain-containing protein [Candidatus Delongbacteria bacterium]
MKGKIFSINIAEKKKGGKSSVQSGELIKDIGLKGDAYNKPGDRQISLISIEKINEQDFCPRVRVSGELIPGDFSETLTIEGMNFEDVSVGDTFKIGENALIEISQIGMTCYKFCPIGKEKDECPLPKYFLFAKVLKSGVVVIDDTFKKILRINKKIIKQFDNT